MRAAIYMVVAMAVSGLATAGTHGAGHSAGYAARNTAGNIASNTASATNTVGTLSTAGAGTVNTTKGIVNTTGVVNTAGTVNTAGDPAATPGISTPVNQPTTPPPSATTTPPPGVTPLPMQSTRPADGPVQMTDQRMVNPGHSSANNPANFQQRISPASRGIGTPGKPDCSRMRGIDKAECERRDTVRDDLPAGVTTTQPQR